MREIKFRALTRCNVELYGYYVYDKHLNIHFINTGKGVQVGINPDTLRQYTGLKDRNGKEIYEGDICLDEDGIGKVDWIDDGFCYSIILDNGKWQYECPMSEINNDVHIIGNIYSNPELLEG